MPERLEQLLSKTSKDLYSFAHALIPDHLQAYQIGLDAISAHVLTLQDAGLLGDVKNRELSEAERHQHELQLFSKAYTLGLKRHQQLEPQPLAIEKELEEYREFYSLNFLEKTALYLKHKTNFSLEDIAVICGQSKLDLVNHLNLARQKLVLSTHEGRNYEGPQQRPPSP
jgi:predicted DNA-binding protein (UPF0251 family)